jgi:SAM-dependent methyltransferase
MIIKHSKKLDRVQQKAGYPKRLAVEKIQKIAFSVHPGNVVVNNCRICRSYNSRKFVYIYNYLWRMCMDCKSVFVANPPTTGDLLKMYESDEYASMNRCICNKDNKQFRVNEIMKPKYEFVKQYITTKKNTWLDIGCGPGELLHLIKKDGWECVGIDADPMSPELGREYFDVEIIKGYFSLNTAREMDSKYGVVSMLNVLEHCLEPHTLIEATSLLQDVGDNLMIEIPHFPSLSGHLCATFPNLTSRVLTSPLHLFVFSLQGTIEMLREYGYEPVSCWVYGQDIGELADVLDMLSNGTITFRKLFLPICEELQKIVDKQLLGDHFIMFSEKRE